MLQVVIYSLPRDTKRRQEVLILAAEAYARKDPAGAAAWLPAATRERLLSAMR